jgi:DnaJ-class molecular chaperone
MTTQQQFDKWLDDSFSCDYNSPTYHTKEITKKLFGLLSQQSHLDLVFTEISQQKEEIRELKQTNTKLKRDIEQSNKDYTRLLEANKLGNTICDNCGGEGDWQTSPDDGQECNKCSGSGMMQINNL